MKLGLVFALTAASLLAQNVDVEFDESVNFSAYKTFAIRDGEINSKAPALNNDLARKNLENSVRRHFASRGLTESTGTADLNIRYTLGSSNAKEVDRYPAGWRGRRTRTVVTQVSQGTLVIDLRDASKRELVWRAVVNEREPNPAKLQDKLDNMVKKAAEKYPPKK
jgi:hypothetical protein